MLSLNTRAIEHFDEETCLHVRPSSILSVATYDEAPSSDVTSAPTAVHYLAVHTGGPLTVEVTGDGPLQRAQLDTGAISFVPAGSRTRWSWDRACQSVVLNLPVEIFADAQADTGVRGSLDLRPRVAFYDPVIYGLALRLADSATSLTSGYLDAATRFLAEHLLTLCPGDAENRQTVPVVGSGGLSAADLMTLRRYFQMNLNQQITLRAMARRVNLSRDRFAHAFKASTGEPPRRYLMRVRAEAAVKLIRSGMRLAEVAARCGFVDQSHMGRHVREMTGRTPASLNDAYETGAAQHVGTKLLSRTS